MTMRRILLGLMVAVALCLTATMGEAQTSLVFVSGGGSALSDARSFDLNYIPFTSSYANGAGANVGFEMPLKRSNTFGIEFSYGLGQNNLNLSNQNTNPVTTTSFGLRDNRFSIDIAVHSPSTFRKIRPYLVAGPEYDLFSPTSTALSNGQKYGFGTSAPVARLSSEGHGGVNIGGGLDYNLTEKWGVRIDVRDHFTGSPRLGLPYSSTLTSTAYFPVSGDAHNIQYTIGIVYHFGGGKPSSTATTKSPKPTSASRHPSPGQDKPSPSSVFY
jgi:hypothetical protein